MFKTAIRGNIDTDLCHNTHRLWSNTTLCTRNITLLSTIAIEAHSAYNHRIQDVKTPCWEEYSGTAVALIFYNMLCD